MRIVDAAIQHHFCRPLRQSLGREFAQQRDWIVIELPPADWIEIAEEIDDFRMPGPPQVAGQRPTLVVERLSRKFPRDKRVGLWNNGRINGRHAKVPLRLE